MRKFRKPYLKTIYLEVKVSDKELEEIRKDVMEDFKDDECSEDEIEQAVEDYLEDFVWDKFSEVREEYEKQNKEKLESTDDWDIEEI